MDDMTLYLGGTRSGKSARAEEHVLRMADGPVLYVATAESHMEDAAMAERIRRHQARRPPLWRTLECPRDLAKNIGEALSGLSTDAGRPTILLDCVTLWVSNILCSLPDFENPAAFEGAVRAEAEALLSLMRTSNCRWVLVSGETGLGGIAASRMGRVYDDGLGLANQLFAAEARESFLVVAGRLLRLGEYAWGECCR